MGFSSQPSLKTGRLIMRPFDISDASEVQRMAGDRAVADTTSNIPHPYEDGMAEEWINSHPQEFKDEKGCTFAITIKDTSQLAGAIGLKITQAHERAELGYWIGREYWGNGYCTEAAQSLIEYGFSILGINRIEATYMMRNPASGRVMQKLGMKHEGCLRSYVIKWDAFEDAGIYAILRGDWKKVNDK